MPPCTQVRVGDGKTALKRLVVNDNTQPSARVGRKAYRVSLRQPGCRNVTYLRSRLFCVRTRKLQRTISRRSRSQQRLQAFTKKDTRRNQVRKNVFTSSKGRQAPQSLETGERLGRWELRQELIKELTTDSPVNVKAEGVEGNLSCQGLTLLFILILIERYLIYAPNHWPVILIKLASFYSPRHIHLSCQWMCCHEKCSGGLLAFPASC